MACNFPKLFTIIPARHHQNHLVTVAEIRMESLLIISQSIENVLDVVSNSGSNRMRCVLKRRHLYTEHKSECEMFNSQ